MAKFRKKPVVIDAVKWISFMPDSIKGFLPGDMYSIEGRELKIRTLEGVMTADDGDFIIRGIKGEYYPCKPDIFSATYEPVEA